MSTHDAGRYFIIKSFVEAFGAEALSCLVSTTQNTSQSFEWEELIFFFFYHEEETRQH